jgi:hypothetical protein
MLFQLVLLNPQYAFGVDILFLKNGFCNCQFLQAMAQKTRLPMCRQPGASRIDDR